MKPKLNLMSMADLDKLVRNKLVDRSTRDLALDELIRREARWNKQRSSSTFGPSIQFSRFNYATS